MDEAEFDKFATEYRALHAASVRVSGEAPERWFAWLPLGAQYDVVAKAAQ